VNLDRLAVGWAIFVFYDTQKLVEKSATQSTCIVYHLSMKNAGGEINMQDDRAKKRTFNEVLSNVELQQQLLLIAIHLEDDELTTEEAARRLMDVAHSLAEDTLEAYDQIISGE
jgi:RNase H-fold protein (predicted Holliday junction resolvase)